MLTMEEAMKQSATRFAAGEIVKGTIIEVRPKEALVDIGYKSEGVIGGNEFVDLKTVKVGDVIDVLIEKLEDKDGMVVLSKEKAEFKQNWDRILTICNEGGTVLGKVKSAVKGGLVVHIGVEAFLPASQIDIIPPKNLAPFIGNTYEFKVVKINQERQNIVLSRRELIEQERFDRRSKLLSDMTPGDIRKGVVKNLTDFGAFIDLNGLDGLLHITDMSWGRIGHPSEILKVGQEIDVVVLDVNREKERVSLGLKQKLANPWEQIEAKFTVGQKVKGKVVNLVPYGAFVELEPGIEGLVHVSEMDWTNKNVAPSKIVALGDEVEVMVLEIDEDKRRISLGMKQCKANPWQEFASATKRGDRVKGPIKSITDFGVFVGLAAGIDGLVHLSDLSWNETGEAAVRNFKKGQEVEAVVLAVDVERERISLGIKQLDSDPFTNFVSGNDKGQIVTGTVKTVDAKGAEIDLGEDIIGYLRVSEISRDRVEDASHVLKVGDEVSAVVVNIDRKTRNIQLSIKAKDAADQADAMANLSQQNAGNAGTTSLGALLRAKLDNNEK